MAKNAPTVKTQTADESFVAKYARAEIRLGKADILCLDTATFNQQNQTALSLYLYSPDPASIAGENHTIFKNRSSQLNEIGEKLKLKGYGFKRNDHEYDDTPAALIIPPAEHTLTAIQRDLQQITRELGVYNVNAEDSKKAEEDRRGLLTKPSPQAKR